MINEKGYKRLRAGIRSVWMLLALAWLCTACEKEGTPTQQTTDSQGEETQQEEETAWGKPFDNIPPVSDMVMYEVNLRAFSANGDLPGVTARLDALDILGVNVIWLMPIHPIGEEKSVNSPYSVRDYKAVSQEYGSLNDLRALTTAAHERDMAVVMDWVANHTAWDNDWISNTDWYTQDASGNIVHPPGTNWQDVADLNFSNATMRLAMIDAMKYWVQQANIDGFRCDYADGVPYDFWKQAIDSLSAMPNRELIFLAEGNRSDHYSAGFDLTYGWDFYHNLKEAFNGQSTQVLLDAHAREYQGIPDGKHKLRFTTNHDESAWDATPMQLFNGKEGALAASVLSIFMDGAPLLYTGQEVGQRENVPFFSNDPIDWSQNPDMLDTYQQLTGLYNQSEPARYGKWNDYSSADVVSFTQSTATDTLLVMVNIRNQPVEYAIPEPWQSTAWHHVLPDSTFTFQTTMELKKYDYFILENE